LLISADHWSGRLGGWTGSKDVLTPTLDLLASGGISFSNTYSACPICVPARRALMTGLSPRGHGLRGNLADPMPDVCTLPEAFGAAGYQTFAVGKLHVSPQRSRIGFDDVLACEEGRHPPDMPDDWEMFLGDRGFRGRQYDGAGTQNDYMVTPWHLPEDCHPTNWAAREMARVIRRRERGRPAFWYLSFIAPHPPIWPLPSYLDLYRDMPVSRPVEGSWVEEFCKQAPPSVSSKIQGLATSGAPAEYIDLVRRAFFATMTHIDHQIRAVLGTLNEEGLRNNTIVAFTSDHGDMLGQHRMWGKTLFYEDSTRIPLVILPPQSMDIGPRGRVDDRLVEISDIMPTLLDLCGIPIPETVEGHSIFGDERRLEIFGEFAVGKNATRMLRQGNHKLIYYPAGNKFQLFDLASDPGETRDLFGSPGHKQIAEDLQGCLAAHLYGEDQQWLSSGKWVGVPAEENRVSIDLGCHGQRGCRF
jgi:arylsulfatase A-like enzyme